MLILKCKEMIDVKKIVQEVVAIVSLFAFVVGVLFIYAERNEKIENGEMIQVSESYMR